jgi:hypothetical protein
MSGVTAAGVMAGAAVVGAGASIYGAMKAGDAAEDATQASSEASAAELNFARENQARWDEVFGPIQDNLAKYYNNLDPNSVAATNVVGIQKAYQESQKQIDVQLAQRGMGNSGLSAELMSKNLYSNEQSKAQARLAAPKQVAAEQASFLGLGMGLESSLQASQQSAYQSMQANANNQYNAASQQEASANSSLGNVLGSGMKAYSYYNQPQATSAVVPVSTYGGVPDTGTIADFSKVYG